MNRLVFALGALLSSVSAFATQDSYVDVKFPVSQMQEDGYFFVTTIAWDGVSHGLTHVPLTLKTMQSPHRVQGLMAGEDANGWVENVNELVGSGVAISDLANPEDPDYDSSKLIQIEIDATEAAKKGDAVSATRATKLAIYTAVANLARYTKRLEIVLKGVPSQRGIKNPLPARFKYPFTMKSPFVTAVKKELLISN